MCRVEERIYIRADGHRSKFEESFPCDKARGGKLCSKVKRRTSEYYPKRGSISRDDTPSPINPPTPTESGTYLVQQRRPSGTGQRPSTRDGQKAIIIEFGSKKDKGKKYPSVSISSKSYKRSSLGASSIGSNDVAVESSGSDASHTIRTGFPEAPLPATAAFGQPEGYITTPTVSHGHTRNVSSTSSFTGSSRTPSLYVTSDPDYDSPTSHRTARYPPTIVHNSPTGRTPTSPITTRSQFGASSGPYRLEVVSPQAYTQETHTPDGLYPLDYPEFADRSASSHASSGAPEVTRRGKGNDDQRKKKEDDRRRQEESDRKVAEQLEKDENVKQVRFELGRAKGRAQHRAEQVYAENEKARAEAREEARRREREKRDREQQGTIDRAKEKSTPLTNDFPAKRTRRGSMTQAQVEEQRRLLAAEGIHMQGERNAAEARERDERNAAIRQQQDSSGYYDPRGGDRTLSNTNSTMGRRNSMTRRNSLSSSAALPTLARSGSNRRPHVVQPNPPVVSTPVPQSYHGRAPNTRQHGPPISFPANFNQDFRPPPARRLSFSQEQNTFAAPPTRGSGSSLDNPFAPTTSILSPSIAPHDPWDVRVVHDALPNVRPSNDGPYTMQQRGEAVINRSATHSAARQATRAMGRVAGFENDYETDSDSEEDYNPRAGLSGKGKKKR